MRPRQLNTKFLILYLNDGGVDWRLTWGAWRVIIYPFK